MGSRDSMLDGNEAFLSACRRVKQLRALSEGDCLSHKSNWHINYCTTVYASSPSVVHPPMQQVV